MHRCLYCYQTLDGEQGNYHAACSKKMFGSVIAPLMPYTEEELPALGMSIIQNHVAVTGVQTKLSLNIEAEGDNAHQRLTIVGILGKYILKPRNKHYPFLPETEDLTMHLAELSNIKTVPHSLILMKSGNPAYITRRIDRVGKHKRIHMEDLCQLSEKLTEHKYQGSYEQAAKVIAKYSASPGLDLFNYYELILFSFLTGNADMHLKNFSMIEGEDGKYNLAPAYDLVATTLVNPADPEETALNLNGKKKKLRQTDFTEAMAKANITPKQQENLFKKMQSLKGVWHNFISQSFLNAEYQDRFNNLIEARFKQIEL